MWSMPQKYLRIVAVLIATCAVLGFVLGAAIAGNSNDRAYANNRHNNRSWNNACSRRYRSFDRNSGTYLGYDGYRHYCR
jgi:hypothetical protein